MMNIVQQFFLTLCILLGGTVLKAQKYTASYTLSHKAAPEDTAFTVAEYTLDILDSKSVFRSLLRKESDSLVQTEGLGVGYPQVFNKQVYLIKDLDKKEFVKYAVSPVSRDAFLIPFTEPLHWKMKAETKIIGSYTCRKAEVSYGGRMWDAWFTEDILLFEGPYIFSGLPGLILEIEDREHQFAFQFTALSKTSNEELYLPKKGKIITWQEFEKIQKAYYADPFSFVKVNNIKAAEDDGFGGRKKMDFREATLRIQKNTIENRNTIEKDKMISYKQ